jgi:hypothetical protein
LGEPATLDGQGVRAASAIRQEFGLDADCLRVVVLDHDELQSRARSVDKRDPKFPIAGFQSRRLGLDQMVFVQGTSNRVEDAVLVHEALHALSHRFAAEAGRRRLDHLNEGITEYLTREVLIHQYGMRRASWAKRYTEEVAFVDELVEAVGKEPVVESFFSSGLVDLEHKANAKLGWDTLAAAARSLQNNDAGTAISTLRGAAHASPRQRHGSEPGREELSQHCSQGDARSCYPLGNLFHDGKGAEGRRKGRDSTR